jgi:hypothetical protein
LSTWTPTKAIEYLEEAWQDLDERSMKLYGTRTENLCVRPIFQIFDDDTIHDYAHSRRCAICHWTRCQGGEIDDDHPTDR